MNIVLYTNNSETERIKKELTEVSQLTGTLREGCDIINPVIRIDGTGQKTNLLSMNYAYIEDFGRYYFIDDITLERNNLYILHMSVDVLMSFAEQILQQTAIIARQENEWNLNLNDDEFKIYQNPIIKTKKFPTGFTEEAYILAIAGAGDG